MTDAFRAMRQILFPLFHRRNSTRGRAEYGAAKSNMHVKEPGSVLHSVLSMCLRVLGRCLPAIAAVAVARAQALAEYGAKTAGAAISGQSAHLGACTVDSTFFSCASRTYPREFQMSLIAAFVLVLVLFWPRGRRRIL